jgi:hypothetical protein
MRYHILYVVFLIAASALFALLEIEIEGPTGWARNLPTWRVENRWTRVLFGARAITGYHLYSQLFLTVALHTPYAFGFAAPSLSAELRIISFGLLFWVCEDFLWFVFNPAYGARAFNPERIWWHAANWWWIMPRDYWIFTPVGIGFYLWSWVV